MEQVVVVGAGGFGREVIEIFKDQNRVKDTWEIMGFIDDDPDFENKVLNGFPVLGGLDWLTENNGIKCVIAIGDPATKKKIATKLEDGGVGFVNAIHPSVIMSEFVELGKGVIICAGSIFTVNIKLGDHVIVNINSTIGHDTVIKDFCSIMPTVKVNGETTIEEGVFIGTGASFINRVAVGAWTTIGAGAAVVGDIPGKVVAVGVPARVIKNLSD